MALIGTQSGNYETGDQNAQAQAVDLSKPVLAWYDPTMANGIYPPFIVAHTDVIIPDLGHVLLCGEALSGEELCGHGTGIDTYQDDPLQLLGGTGNLITTSGVIVTVTQTGELDFFGGTAELIILRDEIVVVGDSEPLQLLAAPALLTTESILRPADSLLQLLGGPVIVNPVLMPEVCDDLDLAALVCEDLDLAPVAAEELDLDALVCMEA